MHIKLSFRSKDDMLETDEFKSFFLRSLGKSAISPPCFKFHGIEMLN